MSRRKAIRLIFYCPWLLLAILAAASIQAQEYTSLLSYSTPQTADSIVLKEKIGVAIKLKHTDWRSASQLLQEALYLSKRNYAKSGVTPLLQIGAIYYEKGHYIKAMSIFQDALGLTELHPQNPEYLSKIYLCIAGAYFNQNMYDSATYYTLKSMDQHPSSKASSYPNIAMIWIDLHEYDKALKYLEEAEGMLDQIKELSVKKRVASQINLGLAIVHAGKMEWEKGRYYALKVIDDKASYPSYVSNAHSIIGYIYLFQEQPQPAKAIYYLEKSLHSGHGTTSLWVGTHINLGMGYLLLKDYKMALYHQNIALDTTKKLGWEPDGVIYANMAKTYHDMGNTRKAYQYQVLYSNLRDSSIVKEKTKQVREMEVKYQIAEKDKELTKKEWMLSRQQSEIKNRNLWISAISLSLLLLALFSGIVIFNIRRRQVLKQKLIQLQSIMEGEEKERTRLAHELHDGVVIRFSAVKMNLSTLPNKHSLLATCPEYQDIMATLDDATIELRKTAHRLMPDMLLEDGLAEATFYFCKTLIQHPGLEIDFQNYGDLPRLDPDFELSAYRIIQELVQNVLKHAEATHILVQLSYHNGQLNITVEDNGKGFATKNATTISGMGLRSIRARVHALNGYFDLHSIAGKGTIAYLEFEKQT